MEYLTTDPSQHDSQPGEPAACVAAGVGSRFEDAQQEIAGLDQPPEQRCRGKETEHCRPAHRWETEQVEGRRRPRVVVKEVAQSKLRLDKAVFVLGVVPHDVECLGHDCDEHVEQQHPPTAPRRRS